MLRCGDLAEEAVHGSSVRKAQIQSGSGFPFSAVCSSCVYCLLVRHRAELQHVKHCSSILLQGLLVRSGAAQMWKKPNVC